MKSLAIIIIISLLVAFITGCSGPEKVYVCVNGKEVQDKAQCPTNKLAGVKKVQAETYARNYVNAYFMSSGGRAQLVSSYLNPDVGDYFATFVVAEKNSQPYETVVVVDGKTGQVHCNQSCEYTGEK